MLAKISLFMLIICIITGCISSSHPQVTQVKPIPILKSTIISNSPPPHHIALLLPLSGQLANAGNAVKEGFMAAYQQAQLPYHLDISSYDTVNADLYNLYQQALRQGADFVIGPLTKEDMLKLAGLSTLVPSIALNYLPNEAIPNGYYAFDLSPQSEAQQVAMKAKQAGASKALLITPETSWGQGIAQAFKSSWIKHGGEIVGYLNYTSSDRLAEEIKGLLHFNGTQKHRDDADVILLAATPKIARQIRPLLKFYYAGNLPIYAISSIYTGQTSIIADRDLDGIRFADMPWVIDPNYTDSLIYKQLADANPISFQRFPRLYALGIDAFYIANHLTDLKTNFYTGATGWLHIDPQRRIVRQLTWAQFHNGKALPL